METKVPIRRNSNLLSRLICWNELCLATKKFKKEITEDDFYPLKHESQRLGDKLEAAWLGEENFKLDPSLKRALLGVFGFEFFFYGFVYFPLHISTTIFKPMFLRNLLNYYEPNQTKITTEQAYLDATALIGLSFLEVLSYNFFHLGLLTLGMKIRIACSSLIYRKLFKLGKNIFKEVKIGQMINLLSNDAKRLDSAFATLHFLWIAPLELVVAGYYLFATLEPPALAGIGVLSISLLFQVVVSQKVAAQRRAAALNTDQRICLLNHLITNFKTIKMNTWEPPIKKSINSARNFEMVHMKRANYLRSINSSCKFFLTELCSYTCIIIAVLVGTKLSSDFVFGLRSTYDIIKTPISSDLPEAITQLADLKASLKRIQEFLTLDYKESKVSKDVLVDNCVLKSLQTLKKENPRIEASDVTLKLENSTVLKNVNFSVFPGELVGVIGTSGTGKSALLQALLREVRIDGTLEVKGEISYSSQVPWIFPSTIKQNIIFGQELNLKKYRKVLQACDLEHDISVLPFKDDTPIGEKGIVLSEGQEALVHLARAVYKNADIYLLDDPFASIESSTSTKIFQDCIQKFLKDKIVLLVTNKLAHFRNFNKILHLKKRRMITIERDKIDSFSERFWSNYSEVHSNGAQVLPLRRRFQQNYNTSEGLKYYCKLGGSTSTIYKILFMFLLVQSLVTGIDSFLTFWVNLVEAKEKSWLNDLFKIEVSIFIYTGLVIFLIFSCALSTKIFVNFCIRASKNLHELMFVKVLYRTMSSISQYSNGHILNSFSKDLGAIDDSNPIYLKYGMEMLLSIVFTGITVSTVNHYMVLPTLLLFAILLFYNYLFDDKPYSRLEGIVQGSIYTHLTATIQGMPTIRSSNIKVLQEEFDKHQDCHTSFYHMNIRIANAFNFWSELTRVVYTAITIYSFFFLQSYVGSIGLALTLTMQSSIIKDAVKAWNDIDTNTTALERIIEHMGVPSEPHCNSDVSTELETGRIEFKSVSMKYSLEGPQVLKRASFLIERGEKIGVLGNSACGKSSLISVLFRLYSFEGTVLIDQLDTKVLPLQLLRSKIVFVPHQAVLLVGTLRQNLDPLEQFSDGEIWQVLHEFGLKELILSMKNGLYSGITEDCSFFSVKQIRLLYLVSGFLKKSKIIVLDKGCWDRSLMRVIRTKFKGCTVLTLALNLRSVMSCDKVLIMNDGCVVKFGSPSKLEQISCIFR